MWRLCLLAVAVAVCPVFTCSEAESMDCVQTTETGFVNSPCPANFTCPVQSYFSMAPVSCVSEPVEGSPEDLAADEQMCAVYKEEGDRCEASEHCGQALYCGTPADGFFEVCLPVKTLGDACEEFAECREGSVCNQKVCIELFSLPQGKAADTKTACRSARIAEGKCAPESVTVGERPKLCASDEDCTSSIGLPGRCECGANPQGQGYCALHESDEPVKEYLAAVRDVDLEESNYRMLKMVYYPLIKGTKDCWDDVVREVVEKEFAEDVADECSGWVLALPLLLLSS